MTKAIMMSPDTSYSPLFWNEEGAAIGDYDYFFIDDEDYLNDFHRQWVERSLERRALRQSKRYTHEQLKAQSQRMDELVRKQEEEERRKRKTKTR